MGAGIYRYQFTEGVAMQDVEESLDLAILAADRRTRGVGRATSRSGPTR